MKILRSASHPEFETLEGSRIVPQVVNQGMKKAVHLFELMYSQQKLYACF